MDSAGSEGVVVTVTMDEDLAAIFEAARRRWLLRECKISPHSKRYRRRWRAKFS